MSRRAYMPLSVRLDAALLALGLDPKRVRWDHRPALSARQRLPDGRYDPDENDPRYIEPVTPEEHDKRTFGRSKATTAGSDIHFAAKIRRREKKAARPKRHWPSRKLQSRPFARGTR